MDPVVNKAMMDLRSFLFDHVYLSPSAKAEEPKAYGVVRTLFEHYLANPDDLPPDERPADPADLISIPYASIIRLVSEWVMTRTRPLLRWVPMTMRSQPSATASRVMQSWHRVPSEASKNLSVRLISRPQAAQVRCWA